MTPAAKRVKRDMMNIAKYFFSNPARTAHNKILSLIVAAAVFVLASGAQATSGTWTNLAGGLWSAGGNWLNGVVADGDTFTANFSQVDLLNNVTVSLDSSRNISTILFGDTDPSGTWTLDNNANAANVLTFLNSGSALNISVSKNVTATISAGIMTGGTAFTGGNTINHTGGGTLVLGSPMYLFGDANGAGSARVTVEGGGILSVNNGYVKAASTSQSNRGNGNNTVGATSTNNTFKIEGASSYMLAGSLTIGGGTFGNNTAVLSSPGNSGTPTYNQWGNGQAFFVGVSSTNNSLIISNGAYFAKNGGGGGTASVIGQNSGGDYNTLLITGAGSTLTRLGGEGTYLMVGVLGSHNSLVVADGGLLRPKRLSVGANNSGAAPGAASYNALLVTGVGSIMDNRSVGSNGKYSIGGTANAVSNYMSFENGGVGWFEGTGTANTFAIGQVVGADNNYLRVSGPGSAIHVAFPIPVVVGGNNGASTPAAPTSGGTGNHLDVGNGGHVDMTANSLYLLGANSVFNLGDGSLMSTGTVGASSSYTKGIYLGGAGSVLNFNNGRLIAGSGLSSVDDPLVSGTGVISNTGPGLISALATGNTISNNIVGPGSLILVGGTLALSGSNTCAGMAVSNGTTLRIDNSNSLAPHSLEIATGGTVNLNFPGTVLLPDGLSFDGVAQALGTWGSLASSATHKDARFQGAGIVLVTPFTSTFSLSIYYNYSPPLDSFATITISNTLPGHRYQVQYSDALPPVWFDVSHVTLATGTTKVVTDESVLEAPQRYYRAKLLP